MQRGSIVDSVSHEADHVSLAAEKANDPLLVSRSKTSEKRRLFGRIRQFRVRHLLHGLAQEHRIGLKAHVPAHLAADQVIIAGKDLHSYAVLVQRLDCDCRRALGRVEKCNVPFQHEVALVLL